MKVLKLKHFIEGTGLSILVFFSISFMFVLYRIGSFAPGNNYDLSIGFPLEYYGQTQLKGNNYLNSGWDLNHLFWDCFITWVVVCGLYILIKNKRKTKIKI
jgi:hypothetical protein